ncbi:NUDIX domain-containing protein [Novosphingobium panipatense]|uniref:NUDIX domain-containing protein n=1 Tax=Novosphingobium panipatense TaxID=428991 RepID=A0ABY1Q4I6_9SPHN|nr:NUDIX domain-containing protein [Novosphingobium panipatense]SMP58495.1 NUDIX domain-containing protein [Novosphingobium panipatense]
MKYQNPTPVAVQMQAAWTPDHERGLIVIKRPDTGGWAFPAGYVETDLDDSAESAAAREFAEETGWRLAPGALFHSTIIPSGHILLFVRSTNNFQLNRRMIDAWRPTSEALELRVALSPEDLCFPAHAEAMRLWFDNRHW